MVFTIFQRKKEEEEEVFLGSVIGRFFRGLLPEDGQTHDGT